MDVLLGEPRAVLIALDTSPGAEFAFEWAIRNYCKGNDVLHLVYVRRSIEDVAARVEREAEAGAQALLQRFMERALQAKFQCKSRIVTGDEREAICKEVLWVCADVLIVGSSGLNRMQRVFLGSVSEYCAHHSACPVIIVKPAGKRLNNGGSSDYNTSEIHIPGLQVEDL